MNCEDELLKLIKINASMNANIKNLADQFAKYAKNTREDINSLHKKVEAERSRVNKQFFVIYGSLILTIAMAIFWKVFP